MATKRLTMIKTKEILRQKWVLGRSHREVAYSVGVSAGVVAATLTRAGKAELTEWSQVEPLDDAALERCQSSAGRPAPRSPQGRLTQDGRACL